MSNPHWPDHIVTLMRDRNVLTVALDLIGGVRGSRDMCLSDCANDMTVLEWYINNWTPSDCPFDKHALGCIRVAKEEAGVWFDRGASDLLDSHTGMTEDERRNL